MNFGKRILFLSIAILSIAIISSCLKKKSDKPQAAVVVPVGFCDTISFSQDISPIITTNCATACCHVVGFTSPDLSNYANIKVYADNGKIKDRAITQLNMPPSAPLVQSQLDKIKCWLDNGSANN